MHTTTEPTALGPGVTTKDALDALYATGHWLLGRHRYRDAAAVFRVLVLCAPTEERGYLALGACHEGLGQEGIALQIYEAATVATTAPRGHVARARLLRKAGRADESDRALDDAWELADAGDDEPLRALVSAERGAS